MIMTLAISHNIFLTRDERLRLANGEPIETIGVSVPVWFYQGTTSEPASEIFCKYWLHNTKEMFPVTALAEGYKINLPQVEIDVPERLPPDVLAKMSQFEIEQWEKNNVIMPTGADLLDIDDGGTGQLKFKSYNKIRQTDKNFNVIHTVEIGRIEVFETSVAL